MLVELIKKYKNNKINEFKKIEFNQEIDNLLKYFLDETSFSNLDIDNFISFLEKNNYTDYPLEKVRITLTYIKRNNSFSDPSCKSFFESLRNYLTNLKEETLSTEELEQLIIKVNNLLNTISNPDIFIEDMELIVNIIKELRVSENDIFACMLEINKHNLNFVNKLGNKNELLVQKEEEKIEIIVSNDDLLKQFGYNLNLSDEEKKIINSISNEFLKEKLDFFKNTPKYSFLSQFEYQKLLITLLKYAKLENIKKVLELSIKHNLDLKEILPTFYLNKDLIIDEYSDEFYKTLTGTYEYFIENIRMLEVLDISISEMYQNSINFFMTNNNLLKENIKTFKEYEIPFNSKSFSLLTSLMTNDLQTKLDRFIETNLFDYVKEYPSILLNQDKALFHRIQYARQNNLPIKRRYLSSFITSTNGYQINEENYEEIVTTYTSPYFNKPFYDDILSKPSHFNEQTKENSLIKALDTYLFDKNTYYIANTYISRFKVLRLYQGILDRKEENPNYFEGVLFSILHSLIVDKDKYEDIVLEVMKFYKENEMIYFDVAVSICRKLGISVQKIFQELNSYERTI